ncbi:MAG: hypothetical protein AAF791_11785 [Bacteroidota bacterium]
MPRVLLFALAFPVIACADPEPPPDPPPSVRAFSGDYVPVDDGAEVPGWTAFRDSLRATLVREDTLGLLTAIAPDARLSYDTEAVGPDGFRAMWFSGDPPQGRSPWATLAGVLDGGSLDEDGAVIAPFVQALWPDDHDPLSSVAIVETDVEARAAPSAEAEVVATLSTLIVPALAPPDSGWRQIQLPDGQAAFVVAGQALSPLSYRATFWPDPDGTWRLRSFLAGD